LRPYGNLTPFAKYPESNNFFSYYGKKQTIKGTAGRSQGFRGAEFLVVSGFEFLNFRQILAEIPR